MEGLETEREITQTFRCTFDIEPDWSGSAADKTATIKLMFVNGNLRDVSIDSYSGRMADTMWLVYLAIKQTDKFNEFVNAVKTEIAPYVLENHFTAATSRRKK